MCPVYLFSWPFGNRRQLAELISVIDDINRPDNYLQFKDLLKWKSQEESYVDKFNFNEKRNCSKDGNQHCFIFQSCIINSQRSIDFKMFDKSFRAFVKSKLRVWTKGAYLVDRNRGFSRGFKSKLLRTIRRTS